MDNIMEKLTPQQALKILENVTENVQLNRKDHLTVINSLQVLKNLLDSLVEKGENNS